MMNTTTPNGTNQDWEAPPVSAYVVLTIGALSTIFNGLLILVMVLNSKQIFASLGSYFIMNLAIADFITGINSVFWSLNTILNFSTNVINAMLLSVFWLTVQVSFYTIFIMSTERLIAIVFPFRASLLMSKRKTVIYCISVWIVSVVPVSFGLRSGEQHQNENDTIMFSIVIVFEFLIAIIVVEYIFVFRQLRAMWLQSKSRVVYSHNNETASCIQEKQTSDVQREYQATLVVICLVVVLVFTVFPYQIAVQIVLSCTLFTKCPANTTGFLNNFMWYYFPVELVNFVINPIVYAWRLPKYRKAFLATFGMDKKQDDMFGKTEHTNLMSNGGSNGKNCLSRSSP